MVIQNVPNRPYSGFSGEEDHGEIWPLEIQNIMNGVSLWNRLVQIMYPWYREHSSGNRRAKKSLISFSEYSQIFLGLGRAVGAFYRSVEVVIFINLCSELPKWVEILASYYGVRSNEKIEKIWFLIRFVRDSWIINLRESTPSGKDFCGQARKFKPVLLGTLKSPRKYISGEENYFRRLLWQLNR